MQSLITLLPLVETARRRLLPIAIIAVCTAWATFYAVAAINDPEGGDEAILFIKPLLYLLVAAALWAAIEALVTLGELPDHLKPSSDDRASFGATGLSDRRRMAIVISLPFMLIIVSLMGAIIGSAFYVGALCLTLNERRASVILLMVILAIATVWGLFGTVLGVPLPLWPTSVG